MTDELLGEHISVFEGFQWTTYFLVILSTCQLFFRQRIVKAPCVLHHDANGQDDWSDESKRVVDAGQLMQELTHSPNSLQVNLK